MSDDKNDNNVIRLWSEEPINMHDFISGADIEAKENEAVRAIITFFNTGGDRFSMQYNMKQSDVAVVACDYLRMATDQPEDDLT